MLSDLVVSSARLIGGGEWKRMELDGVAAETELAVITLVAEPRSHNSVHSERGLRGINDLNSSECGRQLH